GLAVLSDVTKQQVYALSRYVNEHYRELDGLRHCAQAPIPPASITKPPSAELRPNQTDQDSLPPYDTLDKIVELRIEQRLSREEIIACTGFDPATVSRILRMIDLAEYKRRQAATGLKITTVAFGSGRRMPIAQKWTGR